MSTAFFLRIFCFAGITAWVLSSFVDPTKQATSHCETDFWKLNTWGSEVFLACTTDDKAAKPVRNPLILKKPILDTIILI